MTPWKLVLGAGAACALCCAAPVISAAAALGLGTAGLFAGGMGAIGAYTDSWLPVAAGAVVLATVGGLLAWRRRRPAQPASNEAGAEGPPCCPSCR
jgi:LPXTG-motif cell wall-anchored protein